MTIKYEGCEHMDYIEAVAASDVALLREKEKTYQGSWKRGGGRSAYFMMRRNMDRILNMMARPSNDVQFSLADFDDALERAESENGDFVCDPSIARFLRDSHLSEDIFEKIEEHPLGEDGTVLACIRDLRCYLILIEAEMMARGVVEASNNRSQAKELFHKKLSQLFSDEFEISKHIGETTRGSYPWVISLVEFDMTPLHTQAFYFQRGEFCYLESCLEGFDESDVTEDFREYYVEHQGNQYLRLELLSDKPEIRARYPHFSLEKNEIEYRELPSQWKPLYAWDGGTMKWRLLDKFEAWAR